MTHHIARNEYGTHVVGLFREEMQAERCIDELKRIGIRAEDISIAQKGRERVVGEEAGVSEIGRSGGLSSILSLLGMGSGLLKTLQDMGFPKDSAQYYANRVDEGDILLSVKCDGQCERVAQILERSGASDVNSNYLTRPTTTGAGYPAGREAGTQEMPIREERLIPHKERREGEVEVTKGVVEEERTMRVPTTHEEVTVEHHPVEPRPAERAPEEGTMRIPVSEEDVSISKETVTTGEIEVTKRPVTEEREFRGTVRKEVPHVEKKGEVRDEDLSDEDLRDRERRQR